MRILGFFLVFAFAVEEQINSPPPQFSFTFKFVMDMQATTAGHTDENMHSTDIVFRFRFRSPTILNPLMLLLFFACKLFL